MRSELPKERRGKQRVSLPNQPASDPQPQRINRLHAPRSTRNTKVTGRQKLTENRGSVGG